MIGLFAMHDQQLARVSRPASRCTILRGTELGLKNCVAGDSRVSPPDPADYLAESLRGGRIDAPDCHRGLVALSLAPGIRFGLNLGCFPGAPEPRVRESWCRFRIIDWFDEETVFEMPVLSPPGQSGADFCLGGRSLPPVGVLVGETYWRCRRGGVE